MSTTPQQRIEADLKGSMKAGDRERTSTLRLLLTEVKNERIRRGGEVDDAGFAALTRKAIKQREEAAEQYRKGNRPELADKEEREARLLAVYLPAQADEGAIRAAVAAFLSEQGLSGPAAMGPVMKEMKARFGASADGATLNRIAREVLGGR